MITGKLYLKKHQSLAAFSAMFLLIAFSITVVLSSRPQFIHILAATQQSANLPTPQNVQLIKEDSSVVMSWNNLQENTWWPDNQSHLDQGTQGFVVFWGVYSGGSIINPVKKLTEHPALQIQPLTPGITYGAQVASVGYDGSVSQLTPVVTFSTDSSRVDGLRQQMTGFFDDFNSPAGPFDELKWNHASSGCVDIGQAGQFINAQFHAHNQVSDGFCDRGKDVCRPRATFDFSGRTGTVSFDMDGAQRRDDWYLDLYPTSDGPIDVPGHANLDSTNDPNNVTPPVNTLRFEQVSNNINIFYFDNKGEVFGAKVTGGNLNQPVIKNVRRHWIIKINQDSDTTIHTQDFIDGVLQAEESNVPFAFSKV